MKLLLWLRQASSTRLSSCPNGHDFASGGLVISAGRVVQMRPTVQFDTVGHVHKIESQVHSTLVWLVEEAKRIGRLQQLSCMKVI